MNWFPIVSAIQPIMIMAFPILAAAIISLVIFFIR